MHLVITRDNEAAISLIRRNARIHFGKELMYSGQSLPELLASMPILSKEDLIDYGAKHSEQFLCDAVLFSETSGTTSTPLQTPRSKHDLGWNIINQMNAYKLLVQPSLDRVAILHPSILSPFVEGSAMALHHLGVGCVRIFPIPGVCEYPRIFEVLERYRITSIMSTPTLLYKLLYELRRVGEGRLPEALKKAFVTGERFCAENARNMQRILGSGSQVAPFVYGSSETATIMIGQPDCSYRPIAEDFVFEIFSPEQSDTNSVCGNLLVTWLREGMLPILRYDSGDIFTATRIGDGQEFTFHFEGRTTLGGLDIRDQSAIEAAIYCLPVPIFHFECMVNQASLSLYCTIITEPSSTISIVEVIASLENAIGHHWRIDVVLNPETHPFLNFSPSPKSKRFQHA